MTRARAAVYVEIAGMILLLVSAGWQLFIDRTFADEQSKIYRRLLDDKVESTWRLLLDKYNRDYPNRINPFIAEIDQDNEQYFIAPRQADDVESQSALSGYIMGGLFVLGGILTVIAKGMEIEKNTDKTSATVSGTTNAGE